MRGWVALARRTKERAADVELLGRPPAPFNDIAALTNGFGMFGSFILIPQLAYDDDSTGYGFGLSATGAGLLMLPGALVMLVVGPVSAVLGARMGNKAPPPLGGLPTPVGLALMGVAHGSQADLLVFNLITSVGIGLAY